MFNKRYRRYIQSFLLVVPMSALVTAINTTIAKGIDAVFTQATLHRWCISFAVAYPAILFMAPLASKLTDHIVKK